MTGKEFCTKSSLAVTIPSVYFWSRVQNVYLNYKSAKKV